MHASLLLLDAALELANIEVAALASEDDELLERLSLDRESLMDEAWERREGCPETQMLERLLSLQEIHTYLREQVRQLTNKVRVLQHNKKESFRMNGYQATTQINNEAMILSRQG